MFRPIIGKEGKFAAVWLLRQELFVQLSNFSYSVLTQTSQFLPKRFGRIKIESYQNGSVFKHCRVAKMQSPMLSNEKCI